MCDDGVLSVDLKTGHNTVWMQDINMKNADPHKSFQL